ncbi:MAG: DUF58 domain-containing protein [Bradymonadia bacterium]
MSELSRDIIAEIRKIEVVTRRLVNQQMAGHYQSVFKGRGMSFDEVRAYTPGDEPRLIDWNVTARTGEPHVKTFVEERELTVMLLVDMSGSMSFGTVKNEKRIMAAKLAAMMAFSAITNGDRVGLVAFTDTVEHFIPPKKGRKHVLRIIDQILRFSPEGRGTNLDEVLTFIGRVQRRKAVVFVISDFMDDGFEKALNITARRHDLIPIRIVDPAEEDLPDLGLVLLEDAETGMPLVFDSGSRSVRESYTAAQKSAEMVFDSALKRYGVTPVTVYTDTDDYAGPLVNFFRVRARRG